MLPKEFRNEIFVGQNGVVKAEEMIPSQNFAISTDGKPRALPFDISGKTVAELKDLGFTEVMSFNYKPNQRTGQLEPQLSPEERDKMRKALEIDDMEENDPNSYLDMLSDPKQTTTDNN